MSTPVRAAGRRLALAVAEVAVLGLDLLYDARAWLAGGLSPVGGEFCEDCRRWTYGIERGELCDECCEIAMWEES